MRAEEIKFLEMLLEKLGSHLGHTYCIVYPVVQDGFNIGIYSAKTGELIRQESSYDLASTIDRILTGEELTIKDKE
jgi:hypothetical protein